MQWFPNRTNRLTKFHQNWKRSGFFCVDLTWNDPLSALTLAALTMTSFMLTFGDIDIDCIDIDCIDIGCIDIWHIGCIDNDFVDR